MNISNKSQKSQAKQWIPSFEQAKGFFDADGGFYGRITLGQGKSKKCSQNVGLKACQRTRCSDVIYGILEAWGGAEALGLKPILGVRSHSNPSNSESSSKQVSCSTLEKKKSPYWEKIQKSPPIAPTKLQDFLIIMILHKAQSRTSYRLDDTSGYTLTVNEILYKNYPGSINESVETDRIAVLALLWLRKQMYGSQQKINKYEKPIQFYHEKLFANPYEIAKSEIVGNLILDTLRKKMVDSYDPTKIVPQLTEEYFSGYHIGDGSFSLAIKDTGKWMSVKFHWSITDNIKHIPLLEAFKLKYCNSAKIQIFNNPKVGTNYCRLVINDVTAIEEEVISILEKFDYPEERSHQLNLFKEAIKIMRNKDHRSSFKKQQDLINIKFGMNNHNCGPFSIQSLNLKSTKKDIEENKKRETWLKLLDSRKEYFVNP